MKNVYWEYYHPNKKDFDEMKKNALFVFDACSLLNMYSLSDSKMNEIFSILESLRKEKRVWIPHQFGEEYYKGRQSKIAQQFDQYDNAKKNLDKIVAMPIFSDFTNHYAINEKEIREKIKNTIEEIKKNIDQQKNKHPDWRTQDTVCERIEKIFEGNIGNKYSDDLLGEKIEEVKNRMELKKQPGLSDNRSLSQEKINGDVFGWLQIIDHVNKIKKPAILVTDEKKADYWEEKKKSDRVFPRRSLIREFFDKTGQLFFILSTDEFLQFNNKKISYLPIYPEIGGEDVLQENVDDIVIGSEVIGSEINNQLTNK